jgi:hypothetical protein
MVNGLAVPVLTADSDAMSAALAYADAGWYVLPIVRGTKNPGSVVGKDWQRQSSRDPRMIAAWYPGTDHGVALHCGRSAAIVFDVDNPARMPAVLAEAIAETSPPFQSTRDSDPGRGHYVFAMPDGRRLGNGTGALGVGWGDVRGANGVIVAAPSPHANGGRYAWQTTGMVPALPATVAVLLTDTESEQDAVQFGHVCRRVHSPPSSACIWRFARSTIAVSLRRSARSARRPRTSAAVLNTRKTARQTSPLVIMSSYLVPGFGPAGIRV